MAKDNEEKQIIKKVAEYYKVPFENAQKAVWHVAGSDAHEHTSEEIIKELDEIAEAYGRGFHASRQFKQKVFLMNIWCRMAVFF